MSKMRHALSDESTRAATVLGSWCTFPDAIPQDEIIAAFKEKSKRLKGRQTAHLSCLPEPDFVDVDMTE